MTGPPKPRCAPQTPGGAGVLQEPLLGDINPGPPQNPPHGPSRGAPRSLWWVGGERGIPGTPHSGGTPLTSSGFNCSEPTRPPITSAARPLRPFHCLVNLSIKTVWPVRSGVLGGARPRGSPPPGGLSIKQPRAAGWARAHWLFVLSIKNLPCYWLSAAVRHLGPPRPLAEPSLHHEPYCSAQPPINHQPAADWPPLHHLTAHWSEPHQTCRRLVGNPWWGGRSRAVPGGGRWRREDRKSVV